MNARPIPIAAAMLLSACSTIQGQRQVYMPPQGGVQTSPYSTGPEVQAQPVPPQPSGPSFQQPLSSYPQTLAQTNPGPAVLSLYDEARQQAQAGQLEQSEASLERALRIAPRNAFIWQALANLHLHMKQYDQALGEAQRSNSLAHGNPYLQAGNWRTLAAIHRAQGDAADALQAQARADQLTQALSRQSGGP